MKLIEKHTQHNQLNIQSLRRLAFAIVDECQDNSDKIIDEFDILALTNTVTKQATFVLDNESKESFLCATKHLSHLKRRLEDEFSLATSDALIVHDAYVQLNQFKDSLECVAEKIFDFYQNETNLALNILASCENIITLAFSSVLKLNTFNRRIEIIKQQS